MPQNFAQGIRFQTEPMARQDGRILVASGTQSRNRDYYTGKPYRLVPSGMRYDAWAKTGLVLYMHNFNIPLAKGSMYLEDGMLWAPDKLDFHRRIVPVATQNWIGDAIGDVDTGVIADLWEEHYLNSVSIHIMMTQADEENIVELEEEILIPTSEVIEFSVVTVPGDREANRERMLAMGLDASLADCLLCGVDQREGGPALFKPHILSGGVTIPANAVIGDLGPSTYTNPRSEVREMDPNEQDVEIAEETEVVLLDNSAVSLTAPAEEVTEIHAEVLELEETVEIPIDDIVEEVVVAIAEDPAALMRLATAFAANDEILMVFVEALREKAEHLLVPQVLAAPVTPNFRFVKSKVADKTPAKVSAIKQTAQPNKERQPDKRGRHLLGMYRNEQLTR